MLYEESINSFYEYLHNEEKSINTIEKYVQDVKYFYKWLINEKLWSENSQMKITMDLFLEYKQYIKEKYNLTTTINSKIITINQYINFIREKQLYGILDDDIMQNSFGIKTIKCQKELYEKEEKVLTKNDFIKLLEIANEKKNKRLYFIMLTMVSTGIRISEIQYVTVESLYVAKAVVENKGKVRPVIIPRKLCELLLNYCKSNNIINGAIFVTKNKKKYR